MERSFEARWHRVSIALALITTMVLSGSLAARADISGTAIEPQLMLSVDTIKPGQTFLLGIYFRIQHPWHIYWRNPGEAGLPTRVKLKLPPGFVAGDLQWPVPNRFLQPGNLTGYGYEEELLLVQEIQPPSATEFGEMLSLQAEVQWLGCYDVCVPGRKVLEAALPWGAESRVQHQALFSKFAALMPKPVSDTAKPFIAQVSGPVTRMQDEAMYELHLEWPVAPDAVEWFPAPPAPLKVYPERIETIATGTKVKFKVKGLNWSDTKPISIESVVKIREKSGDIRAYALPVVIGPGAD